MNKKQGLFNGLLLLLFVVCLCWGVSYLFFAAPKQMTTGVPQPYASCTHCQSELAKGVPLSRLIMHHETLTKRH